MTNYFKAIITLLIICAATPAFSQSDSIPVQVTRIYTEADTKVFYLTPVLPKNDTSTIAIVVNDRKNKVKRVLIKDQQFICLCNSKRKLNEIVMIAKKDLIITNPKPTRRTLFN